MKMLLGLVGLVVLVGALPPTPQQVRDAILRAKETNAFKRDLNFNLRDAPLPSGRSGLCPMAKYHGRRTSRKVTSDRKTNDLLMASRFLKEAGFSDKDLRNIEVVNEFKRLVDNCPSDQVSCDPESRFRTASGICNNLRNTTWGSAGTAQVRELAPAYDDGISSPRTRSVITGESLPNARLVSNSVHAGGRRRQRSNTINLHVFQFGQFLDHDMIATPIQGDVEDCCAATADVDNCMPIRIEWADDPNPNFFDGYCMNFPRSAPQFCPTVDGANRREQINEITSFIDASNVYGSSVTEQSLLREGGTGGFLATEDNGLRLPNNEDSSHCIPNVTAGIQCSLAGDFRVNVIPSLTSYHTLFVREHNRIAAQLQERYSDDETLFQETRKIVIAVMQKVAYSEFLPTFMGEEAMSFYRLLGSEPYRYEADINPSISNDFGIAYRMGHTWIPRTMDIFNRNFRRVVRERTEATYFNPELTYFQGTRGLEGLTLWLSGENSTETDRVIEDAARNDLFLDDDGNSFDLAALNIQRARDHGLPSYTEYRKLCDPEAEEMTRFRDLAFHSNNIRRMLRAVYSDPRDIDMFTGALSERPTTGESLGPTLQCLLGRQFNRLKFGDRFWYQGRAANFSQAQLRAIENYSMARVLCNNYQFRTVNFPNAFLATDAFTSCDEIPQLDIVPFGGTPTRNPSGGSTPATPRTRRTRRTRRPRPSRPTNAPGGPPPSSPAPGVPPVGSPAPGVPPTGVPPSGVPPVGTPRPGAPPSVTPRPGASPSGTPRPGAPPSGAPPARDLPTGHAGKREEIEELLQSLLERLDE